MGDLTIDNQKITTARLDLYPVCNLDCIHCCAGTMFDDQTSKYLDKSGAIALLDRLYRDGITHLNVLGKEPFLYPHLDTLLEYACERGFRVDITTNGTAIRHDNIAKIVSLGVTSLFFSIDGSCPAVHDALRGAKSLSKALATMQAFLAERDRQHSPIQVNVNAVLTRLNSHDVLNIIRLAASRGVNHFRLSRLELLGNALQNSEALALTAREEFEVAETVTQALPAFPAMSFEILSNKPLFLEYLYRRYKVAFPVGVSGCKACSREIYIDPEGNISPCLSTAPVFTSDFGAPYLSSKMNFRDARDVSIQNCPTITEFRSKYPLDRQTYKNYVPCNSCFYLCTICYPCPLLAERPQVVQDFCWMSQKELGRLEGNVDG